MSPPLSEPPDLAVELPPLFIKGIYPQIANKFLQKGSGFLEPFLQMGRGTSGGRN